MEQTSLRIIVDGLITNEDAEHYVRLTESVGFYQEGKAPGMSGAEVKVTDNEGNLYNFTESETAIGLYTADFQGIAERTYSLYVTLPDGRMFTAAERIEPVMAIDRLEW